MNDVEFSRVSAAALERLNRTMDPVAEAHEVEILHQGGVLSVEIEAPRPSKIIVSPNAPARQVWISAQSTSFKLDWSPEREVFVFPATSESLDVLLGRLIGEELGVGPIDLASRNDR